MKIPQHCEGNWSPQLNNVLLFESFFNIQVASFYDQNHDSNHKNSMVGQSVVVELGQGDKVQVYMYTHTGIMDKRWGLNIEKSNNFPFQ